MIINDVIRKVIFPVSVFFEQPETNLEYRLCNITETNAYNKIPTDDDEPVLFLFFFTVNMTARLRQMIRIRMFTRN